MIFSYPCLPCNPCRSYAVEVSSRCTTVPMRYLGRVGKGDQLTGSLPYRLSFRRADRPEGQLRNS